MPCFDPEGVLFVTNKWDYVDEDEDKNKIWENVKSTIKRGWSLVKEENIFKMNLREVFIY